MCKKKGIDVDEQAEIFRAHSAANGRTFSNPHEGFRYWILNKEAFSKSNGSRNGSIPPASAATVDPDDPMTLDPPALDRLLGYEAPPEMPAEIADGTSAARSAWRVSSTAEWLNVRRLKAAALMSTKAAR